MTVNSLQKEFEADHPDLYAKGFRLDFAFAKFKPAGQFGRKSVSPEMEIGPETHDLSFSRPFILDRKIKFTAYKGFEVQLTIYESEYPDEFKSHFRGETDYEECFSAERVTAYAENHALEICEILGDYSLSLYDICCIIVSGDFEKHKQECERTQLDRLLHPEEYEDEYEDEDFEEDDFEEEDEK